MSDETTADAVRRALTEHAYDCIGQFCDEDIAPRIASAVEAAVREKIAREILAVFHRSGRALPSQTVEALRCAARIARGGAE